MNISGSEGLVAAGNILWNDRISCVDQELPADDESFGDILVMVSGMGTIAGSVMGTYIGMLGGTDPAAKVLFATHLLSASVMAVPGSIVLAKMLCPQTEEATDHVAISGKEKENSNILDAISSGTVTGVKLMTNIAAMLLVFISLVALANYITEGVIGRYTGLNDWIVKITMTASPSFHVVDRGSQPRHHVSWFFIGTKDHIERICRLFPITAMERCRIIHV